MIEGKSKWLEIVPNARVLVIYSAKLPGSAAEHVESLRQISGA
jgi:hypothetical protein